MGKHQTHKRTSDILACLADKTDGEKISLEEILGLLSERAFGVPILILALPNCLPLPSVPGFAAITGIPIMLLGLQMAMGKQRPWLPKKLTQRSFSREKFIACINASLPYLRNVERLLHPRLPLLHTDLAERFMGLAFLILAMVLSLPIPFGNMLPGICIVLISLGLISRDGLMVAAGMSGGAAVCILLLTAFRTIMEAVLEWWDWVSF